MLKKISPVVAMVVVAAVVVCAVMMLRMRKNEGFYTSENEVMDNALTDFIKESADADNSNKINKKDIEKAARAAALQFCPVPPDYNPSLYIKKTEIEKEQACPKVPNMKNYVLKSSIPPPKECPPCICPKVNVSAGLCRDGNKESAEVVCPKPKPCGAEECRRVVKCPAPQGISQVLDDNMVKKYVNELVSDKDYKKINKLKNLLEGVQTPSDVVSDLQEENEDLRKKIRKLNMSAAVSSTNDRTTKLAGMMSNKRSNTNSPVVEYNQKCQNNRANNWYDISGIIGSAFNSNTDPSNKKSNVPTNSVNSSVDSMMDESNAKAAKNNVMETFY